MAARAGTDDPFALVQYLDLKTYLVGDINTKVDRASMAHSLEVREPLMDHPLVEWLASLPSSLKVRGQEGKYLLKKTMEPFLPREIMYRPKMGFAVPLERWFRGPLRQRLSDAILGPRLAATGVFNPRYLKHLVDAHVDRRARLQLSAVDAAHVRCLSPQRHAGRRARVRAEGGRMSAPGRPKRELRSRGQRSGGSRKRGGTLSLRILHILDHSIPLQSGYTFRTRAILREQRRMGWETFHLTSPKHAAPGGPEEEVDGLHFYRTPKSTGRLGRIPVIRELALMRATARRLEAVAREVQPDILHAHSPALNAIPALWVGKRLGIPVVYEVRAFWEDAAADHGTSREWGLRYRLTRALETYALRRVGHVTTICEGLKQGHRRARDSREGCHGHPQCRRSRRLRIRQRARTRAQGSARARRHDRSSASSARSMPTRVSICCSRPCPWYLRGCRRRECCWWAADPRRRALKSLAGTLGVADKVVFAGRVPHHEVQRYYSIVDVFAYPRHAMRLTDLVTPLKPLEAMAQGCLLVASDVGGHRELIRDGETGVLFRAGDATSLAEAIVRLLGERERWPQLRAQGRRFVERERNWAGSVGRYRQVYRTRRRQGGGRACPGLSRGSWSLRPSSPTRVGRGQGSSFASGCSASRRSCR